jgi:hypothetical protein
MPSKELTECSSPVGKLLRFFKKSRDGWKAKQHDLKVRCKRQANQMRAMQNSRSAWRERAEAAEERTRELEHELAELKAAR